MCDYKKYVKPSLHKEFVKLCRMNCLDFYGSGIITTAHLVMEDLMEHINDHDYRKKKCSPKEAWENAMEQIPIHSGYSASVVAVIVARFSQRGKEFKDWCKRKKVVDVNW
jgi:hypothetical protein